MIEELYTWFCCSSFSTWLQRDSEKQPDSQSQRKLNKVIYYNRKYPLEAAKLSTRVKKKTCPKCGLCRAVSLYLRAVCD